MQAPTPILSLTRHEANNSIVWISDKLWSSLTDEQKGWVQAAADEVGHNQPAKALQLDQDSIAKLRRLGVKVVDPVDTAGMIKVAVPIEDEIAAKLGPHAVEILKICRGIPG